MSDATTTERLAQHVAEALQQALEHRGHALLAVSGGKSPIALFERLRQSPLNWSAVTVVLVDERCVPHTHRIWSRLWLGDANSEKGRLQRALQQALPLDAIPPDGQPAPP